MNRQRHQEVGDLFTRARDLPPDRWSAFLDEHCRDDPDLRAEVKDLLQEHLNPAPLMAVDNIRDKISRAAAESVAPPATIGRYRIVRLIGAGGMGVVYEAEQDDPRRRVALKVIRPGMVGPRLLSRFRHEVQVLGQLKHPGIAQIHEAGTTARDQPYFAMEFVSGRPLLDYAAAQGLGTRDRLDLMARICDAVHHAHQKGVIHRDLKPANILVEESGQPKILDFGVARATDADIQSVTLRTDIGELVGTVPYMSPEQASGDPDALDIRSDLYSLGVIIYELLSGRLPYDVVDRSIYEAVRVIREQQPSRLSSVNRVFRGDVETIVAKALEKEKDRRYQSAAELAADIRRYLDDQPIIARPASTLYQLRKFAQRNKAVVGAAAVVFATMLGATIFSTIQMSVAVEARKAADQEKVIALQQARRATIAAATAALEADDPAAARQLLESVAGENRNWEWNYLNGRLDQSIAMLDVPSIVGAGLNPNGSVVITVSRCGTVQWWDPFMGEARNAADLGVGEIQQAVFSRNGRRMAASFGPDGRQVGIWTVTPEESALRITSQALGQPVLDLAISADGARAAAALRDDVWIWDAAASAPIRWHHDLAPLTIAMSDDGRRAGLVTERDGLASFYPFDVATGARLSQAGYGRDVLCLAISPDGALAATGESDRRIRLRQTGNPRVLNRLRGHTGAPTVLDFSTDGSLLVSGGADQTVRLWDVETGNPLRVFGGHGAPIRDVRFSADGSRILSTADDGTVRLWDTADDPPYVLRHTSDVYAVAFWPDGSRIVSGTSDGTLRLWDTSSGECVEALPLNGGEVKSLAVSPDGRFMAAGHKGGAFLLDVATPSFGRELAGHLGDVTAISFAPDSARAVTRDSEGRVIVWDIATATPLVRMHGTALAESGAAFSPDGRRVATTHQESVRIWDAASGEHVHALVVPRTAAHAVAYSPDGALLASGWSDGAVRFHSAATGKLVARLEGHTDVVNAVAFSSDGSRLATGSNDTTIWLWDVSTARPLAQLRGHEGHVLALAFSPDGSTLASGSGDHTVRIWDTEPARTRWTARARLKAWRDRARPIVEPLFETWSDPARVAQALRTDATLSEAMRTAALQLVLTPPLPPSGVRCDPFPGASLEFDGVNTHVRIGSSDDLRMGDTFAIEAWIYPIEPEVEVTAAQVEASWKTPWHTVINKEGEYQIARGPDGIIHWTVAVGSRWIPWVALPYAAPPDRWTHLALVREGQTVRFYLNGRRVHTFAGLGPTGDHHPDMNELWIGGRQHADLSFRGRIDEVRIWRTARRGQQIAESMRQPLDGDESGLIGYWRFDESEGNHAGDLTGNHDGEVVGATRHPTSVCDP